MRRIVTAAAVCMAVPVLTACGDTSQDHTAGRTTIRPVTGTSARPDTTTGHASATGHAPATSTSARRARRPAPLQLAMPAPKPGHVMGVDDPCAGTRRERIRRDHGIGSCADDVADRVVGRDATLRLSGMTVRLRGLEAQPGLPGPGGDGERRPTGAGQQFAVARLTIENRRRTSVTLDRGDVALDLRGVFGPTVVWAISGPGRAIGPDHDAIRFAPGATRRVVAVWQRARTGPQASDIGARVEVGLPDPPGTPKHGGGKHPMVTDRTGVFRLDP